MKLPKGIFKKTSSSKAPISSSVNTEGANDDELDCRTTDQSRSVLPITSFYQSIESDWESSGEGLQQGGPEQEHGSNGDATRVLGLTDGYTDWTHSLEAYQGAIVHSILYLALGVLGYSLVFEKWPIVDSLYFAVVLFTTVGYGDLHPDSSGSEIFTIVFALYGIVIVGVFLGIVGEMAFQRRQNLHQAKMDEVRRKYLDIFDNSSSFDVDSILAVQEKPSFLSTAFRICKAQVPGLAVLFAVGTPVVLLERWTFVKGLYWGVITGTTIGLGDETPQHQLSRALCVLYIPLAVAFTGRFLSLIAGAYIYSNCHAVEEQFMSRTLTVGDLRRMDIDLDGRVSPGEFLIFMLITLQKVHQEDIDDILTLFHKLDKSGDGMLSREDLEVGIKRTSGKLNIPAPDRPQPRQAVRPEWRSHGVVHFFGNAYRQTVKF